MAKRSDLAELVFAKLGGSLITDKESQAAARPEVIRRLAAEVRGALKAMPGLQLLLGHGSGSFGHVVADQYQVHRGCTDWRGYAETAAAAARLNRLVTDGMLEAGVPVVTLQPSASARCRGGRLIELAAHPVQNALQRGLVPLVYGDVAVDEIWGSTIISTEAIFSYLGPLLRPSRILLAGEVSGVYTADPRRVEGAQLVSVIQAGCTGGAGADLGGSHGVDVTGGMRSKVELMLELVRAVPGLRVCVFSGRHRGVLENALLDEEFRQGTVILA
jgi:isopentenyl phosphate kinase